MAEQRSFDEFVADLADEFVARCRRGERPSLSEYTDAHPQHAEAIHRLFPAMALMENVALADEPPASDSSPARGPHAPPTPQRLGDYRIIREIGRGGMGIVYEAEQLSLGRPVALKVLPHHALLDKKHWARFEREARTAALLHHTNIVPVFGVGESDGVRYYAMQYIQGLSLDNVLEEVKRLREEGFHLESGGSAVPAAGAAGAPAAHRDHFRTELAHSLVTGRFRPADMHVQECESESEPPAPRRGVDGGTEPALQAETSTSGPSTASLSGSVALPGRSAASGGRQSQAAYWQSVARIGVQVADALEYAHKQGILHRDVKPSNLLLDARGTAWLADFGLAKVEDERNLTHTGDVLGTLRYMAPECFGGTTDAKSDVYSLGLTLYEMLALRPAFVGRDRRQLAARVMQESPHRLRIFAPDVPRDLETVVHKAIEREPGGRYQSAGALRDDLQRLLDDRPIQARRISAPERLIRLARRHKTMTAFAAVILVLLVVGLIGALIGMQHYRTKEQEAREAADALWYRTYVQNINLAWRAWDEAQLPRLRRLLGESRPAGAQQDHRGFEWYYLNWLELRQTGAMRLAGHEGWVQGVEYSPDGTQVATASSDRTVKIWDAADGHLIHTLTGHVERVRNVAFSPDGRRLASAGVDHTVRIWDVAAGRELLRLEHAAAVYSVAFSPDGTRLATSGADSAARLWEAATGRELLRLEGHAGLVSDVAFSPDGGQVATVDFWPGTIRIWSLEDGREISSLGPVDQPIQNVAFDPGGTRLAGACEDRTLRVWDLDSGRELLRLEGHTDRLADVAFSPDGTRLGSSSWDRTVKLWDSHEGRELATLRGHSAVVGDLAFHPDGTQLASASEDRSVVIWHVRAGPELPIFAPHSSRLQSVRFSPDGTNFVTGAHDGKVEVWNLDSGEMRAEFAHGPWVHEAAFSPDGARIASAGADRTVRIWALADAAELLKLEGHTGEVRSVAFSPSGKWLASASDDRTVRMWDARDGRLVRTLPGHEGGLRRVVFSPHGELIASAAADSTVRLWDAHSGEQRQHFEMPDIEVRGLAFSPDGTRLAAAGSDGTVRVYSAADGRELVEMRGNAFAPWGIAFSPDGRRLAAGGEDRAVRLWDAATGEELLTMRGHADRVLDVDFNADGTRLISAGSDGSVKLWEAPRDAVVLARAYAAKGRWEEAAACLADRLGSGADNAVLHFARGEALLRQGRRKAAAAEFHRADRLAPMRVVPWHRRAADEAAEAHEWSLAVAHIDCLLDSGAEGRALLLLRRGEFQTRRGQWSAAAADFADVLEIAPELRHPIVAEAARSKLLCQALIERLPNDAELRAVHGRLLIRQGDADLAEAQLTRAVELAPKSVEFLCDRGRLYAGAGKLELAEADFARVAELVGDDPQVFLGSWWVAGPYPEDHGAEFPPERTSTPRRTLPSVSQSDAGQPAAIHWRHVDSRPGGLIDLGEHFEHAEHITAYALTYVYCLRERPITLLVGSDDSVRIWINGELVHDNPQYRIAVPGEDRAAATLRRGLNTILAKVVNGTADHRLYFQIDDQAGARAVD